MIYQNITFKNLVDLPTVNYKILEKYFPNERKQCEIIWKPVYDEYRRLGYRLKNNNYEQVELEDYLKGLEMEE